MTDRIYPSVKVGYHKDMKRFSLRHKRALLPLIILCVVTIYFSYHALSGSRGLIAMHKLEASVAVKKERLAELTMQRMNMEHKVQRLSDSSLDLELLDEQARAMLGYAGKDEMVMFMPKSQQ